MDRAAWRSYRATYILAGSRAGLILSTLQLAFLRKSIRASSNRGKQTIMKEWMLLGLDGSQKRSLVNLESVSDAKGVLHKLRRIQPAIRAAALIALSTVFALLTGIGTGRRSGADGDNRARMPPERSRFNPVQSSLNYTPRNRRNLSTT